MDSGWLVGGSAERMYDHARANAHFRGDQHPDSGSKPNANSHTDITSFAHSY